MNRCEVDINPRAIKNYIEKRVSQTSESMGLKRTHGQFLKTIYDNEGLSLKELSNEMYVDKSLTTRVIKSLIDNGFVINMNNESREYRLYLTDKGNDAVSKIEKIVNDAWDELLSELTDDEMETLTRIHMKINEKLKSDIEAHR
ncbi:MAG: MarR family transcriptional regulator [Methanomassiliicoccales archaeon]|uniref:MarR family winged helix-turn-helix transcriptional regulator n=1 Tax=Candidatus Methanarcanum hacksteinii TaxID=2911857 RepID=UPI002A7E5861|nr:MarR family transcriptional regulator [Candidatus Methanomethylophilaceae archaeon]MCI6025470.1 MarR family transcriptional regulator [Methanomassiliicoccales archaeon]MDD7478324.1 MarR family transcriptional regulator [Methanomassiliicoccales archaeon]